MYLIFICGSAMEILTDHISKCYKEREISNGNITFEHEFANTWWKKNRTWVQQCKKFCKNQEAWQYELSWLFIFIEFHNEVWHVCICYKIVDQEIHHSFSNGATKWRCLKPRKLLKHWRLLQSILRSLKSSQAWSCNSFNWG